jgi:hypothetical protein
VRGEEIQEVVENDEFGDTTARKDRRKQGVNREKGGSKTKK